MGLPRLPLLFLPVLLAFPPDCVHAEILRVSKTGDGTDGLSWETAYTAIGDALTASATGDEIWVREDLYQELLEPKVAVILLGGFSGDETNPNDRDPVNRRATIRGNGNSAPFGSVITTQSNLVLDGLIIRSGVYHEGAGVHIVGASLEVRNCVITSNSVFVPPQARGGGIYCASSSLSISDSTISSNGLYAETHVEGPGIYACDGSTLNLERCLFSENYGGILADDSIGAVYATGGAIHICRESNANIRNCLFKGNNIILSDGCRFCSFLLITGDAIFVENSEAIVDNCTFTDNSFNNPTIGSAIYGWMESRIVITNSILSEQYALVPFVNYLPDPVTPEVTYSMVNKGFPGAGNIDADPLFRNPENGDFRLVLNSPCIDTGTATDLSTDIEGNPRPVDLRGRGFEGLGAYDMGAYEFQLSPADLDSNGSVNAQDLILFQDQWQDSGNGGGAE